MRELLSKVMRNVCGSVAGCWGGLRALAPTDQANNSLFTSITKAVGVPSLAPITEMNVVKLLIPVCRVGQTLL